MRTSCSSTPRNRRNSPSQSNSSPAAGGKKNSGKYARYANPKTSTSRFSAGDSRRIARTHSCCTG